MPIYYTFSTNQIRLPNNPQIKNSTEIPTPIHSTPPIGLNSLDVSRAANLRVRAYIDSPVKGTECTAKATVHLDAWGDTILYSAGCTWLDVCKHDRDFQFGTYTAGILSWNSDQPSVEVKFDHPYASTPNIVVWLNELDISSGTSYRVQAYASDITATGFKLTVKTWDDSTLYKATATWIAHPSNRPNIMSGNFDISEIRSWDQPRHKNSKNIRFEKEFQRIPRVLVALSGLAMPNNANPRVKAVAKDITTQGMTLNIDSWGDTTFHWAAASYLAIQDY